MESNAGSINDITAGIKSFSSAIEENQKSIVQNSAAIDKNKASIRENEKLSYTNGAEIDNLDWSDPTKLTNLTEDHLTK